MVTERIRQPIERNIAMELTRVTEAAALSAARYMGMGDKELVDQAAVDAMRFTLGSISMDGIVVIGEGEKDEAPMLYIGERIGDGSPPQVDIAVDPIDGTTLLSNGLPGAIAAVALSARGTMNVPGQIVYVNKIAVGKEAKDAIDIDASVETNLKNVAEAMGRRVEEVTVVVLDRPRHEQLLADIRAVGARVKLITDGDVGGRYPRGAARQRCGRADGHRRHPGGRAYGGGHPVYRRRHPVQGVAPQRCRARGGRTGRGGRGEGVRYGGAGRRRGGIFRRHGRQLRRPAGRREALRRRRPDPLHW